MNPKLSPNVSVVKLSDSILEFFKTNTRQQVHIRVEDDTIMNFVLSLDGINKIDELSNAMNLEPHSVEQLLSFMRRNGLLDNVDPSVDFDSYESFRRPINFLNDFSASHEHLLCMWNNLRDSTVLIVGLGAVGSWVACNLAQSGVKNFILMDNDTVDITNLHRQFGYTESDLGKYKVDVLEERLIEYAPDINVVKVKSLLTETSLSALDGYKISLIINCADKPNVDTTSLWIGEYGMKHNIPHIVGGGYNLHLSLIGQTVIPGESACVMCFQKQLEEINKIDSTRVKKLAVENRKVGSFGPMCSIIASMIGMEAIKVLTKCITPANINRRGEFDIYTMQISYKSFGRRTDCEWCGENGVYNQ